MALNQARWWNEVTWNGTVILCQDTPNRGFTNPIWDKSSTVLASDFSIFLFQHALILIATSTVCFLLRPLRIPYMAQMIGGLLIGLLFPNFDDVHHYKLLPPTVLYLMKVFSFLGFFLHSFLLGVETNMSALKRIGKKSIAISFSGMFTSLIFCYLSILIQGARGIKEQPLGVVRLALLHAQSFFMVTCTHTNYLGISNSEIGRLAASMSMILDIFSMFSSFLIFNVIYPFARGGAALLQPLIIIIHYSLIFAVFRPLVIHIVRLTPEGMRMKQSHFVSILSIALIIACLGELTDHRFSLFLFALTLPEEPLSTILNDKLDPVTTWVFFPIYCAFIGLQTNFVNFSDRSLYEEYILISSYLGKFVGTLVSALPFGLTFWHAFSLGIIMSSKGLFDLVSLSNWHSSGLLDTEEYSLAVLHIVVLTAVLLPIVRFIYEPSQHYSAILRPTVMAACENGTFQALICVFKERDTPGLLRLLESFHPTRHKPIPIIALQLLPLTGRASYPIMAPLHQVTSSAVFLSQIERCNRIVNAFLHVERETRDYSRVQHYISVAPHETMHNDICSLAFKKEMSLIVIPFHMHYSDDGMVEETSLATREVNKMVLEKAPCSVGLLVQRGEWPKLCISHGDVFRIAILFIGGIDDQEALSYGRLLLGPPYVRLLVIWLKPSNYNEDEEYEDVEVLKKFLNICHDNDRVSFKEIIANDGHETTQALVKMKDMVELVIVGRHHDPNCAPVYGLSYDFNDQYTELGILGAMLATPDFGFSILVVQQEPQADPAAVESEEMILI